MRIATATDWFLVQEREETTHIWRIACWYEQADGMVVGLIDVPSNSGIPRLSSPLNSGGTYKHLSELTQEECRLLWPCPAAPG